MAITLGSFTALPAAPPTSGRYNGKAIEHNGSLIVVGGVGSNDANSRVIAIGALDGSGVPTWTTAAGKLADSITTLPDDGVHALGVIPGISGTDWDKLVVMYTRGDGQTAAGDVHKASSDVPGDIDQIFDTVHPGALAHTLYKRMRYSAAADGKVYYGWSMFNGYPGQMRSATTMSVPRGASTRLVAAYGWLYAFGQGGSEAVANSVSRAKILTDGSLGAWVDQPMTYAGPDAPFGTNGYPAITATFDVWEKHGHLWFNDGRLNKLWAAPLNADGSLGTWTSVTPSPNIARTGNPGALVATNNYLYLIGGSLTGGAYVNNVEYAPLTATVPSWIASPTPSTWTAWTSGDYPYAHRNGRGVFHNGNLYLVGGHTLDSNSNGRVFLLKPDAGTPGTFTSVLEQTSLALHSTGSGGSGGSDNLHYVGVAQGRLWVTGGNWGFDIPYEYATASAAINPDGTLGGWVFTDLKDGNTPYWVTVYPSISYHFHSASNSLFGFSQRDGDLLPTLYRRTLNTDGTLGDWQNALASGDLPYAALRIGLGSTDTHVYMLGGLSRGTDPVTGVITNPPVKQFHYAPVNGSGIVGAWQAGTYPEGLNPDDPYLWMANDKLYVMDRDATQMWSTPLTAGVPGAWTSETLTLPQSLMVPTRVASATRTYVIGGETNSTWDYYYDYTQSATAYSLAYGAATPPPDEEPPPDEDPPGQDINFLGGGFYPEYWSGRLYIPHRVEIRMRSPFPLPVLEQWRQYALNSADDTLTRQSQARGAFLGAHQTELRAVFQAEVGLSEQEYTLRSDTRRPVLTVDNEYRVLYDQRERALAELGTVGVTLPERDLLRAYLTSPSFNHRVSAVNACVVMAALHLLERNL